MKAKMYGIDVEGTAEEIAELKAKLDQQSYQLVKKFTQPTTPYIQPHVYPNPYYPKPNGWTEITCQATSGSYTCPKADCVMWN